MQRSVSGTEVARFRADETVTPVRRLFSGLGRGARPSHTGASLRLFWRRWLMTSPWLAPIGLIRPVSRPGPLHRGPIDFFPTSRWQTADDVHCSPTVPIAI